MLDRVDRRAGRAGPERQRHVGIDRQFELVGSLNHCLEYLGRDHLVDLDEVDALFLELADRLARLLRRRVPHTDLRPVVAIVDHESAVEQRPCEEYSWRDRIFGAHGLDDRQHLVHEPAGVTNTRDTV